MTATLTDYRAIWDYDSEPKELANQVKPCNLCGNLEHQFQTIIDRYGFKVGTAKCERCGLETIRPRMMAERYQRFYESGAYRRLVSAFWDREINAETLQPEQRLYAEEWAPWIESYITPAHLRLLDVGGSTGVVASFLAKRYGMDATVLDPAPAELEVAKKKYGCKTIQGTAENLLVSHGKYDLILLCQAVDHLLDPGLCLRLIKQRLEPMGRFFVDIVDFDVTKEVKIDHPFNLTERTMARYLAESGFDVLAKRRANDGKHVGFICR